MHTRPLGRTGLSVSEIGFGAWGIGASEWIGADDGESRRALHRALDLGMNLIDTALAYGDGHSEQVVGQVLKLRPERPLLATKVPPKNLQWPALRGVPVSEVFPHEHVIACCERSLRNLGVEAIDLLQLHVWQDEFLDQEGWQDALDGLKRAGKIRFAGISTGEHELESAQRAPASGHFAVLQVLYNIFDPRAAEALFPLCLAHGVGVLARVPFDEGGLTGTITPQTTFPPGDFRNDYFKGERKREVQERCNALGALLGAEARTLPELALRFCLSHDAVSSVIPGMRRVGSVEANAAVGDGRRLSPPLLEALKGHAWPRNFWED
jgi:aryl-alcohol dehydrogenase-like predicted oxidoreductase